MRVEVNAGSYQDNKSEQNRKFPFLVGGICYLMISFKLYEITYRHSFHVTMFVSEMYQEKISLKYSRYFDFSEHFVGTVRGVLSLDHWPVTCVVDPVLVAGLDLGAVP